MRKLDFIRFTGPLAIWVLWFSALVGARLADLDFFGRRPLSYLGVNASSAPIFSTGLIVAALLLIAFSWYVWWTFEVAKLFLIVFVAGQLAQIVGALVPFGGMYKGLHTFAAFFLAFSLPLHMYYFAHSLTAGRLKQLAKRLFWLEVACFVIGIGTFVIIKQAAPLAQALPAVAFHIWVLTISLYAPHHYQSATNS